MILLKTHRQLEPEYVAFFRDICPLLRRLDTVCMDRPAEITLLDILQKLTVGSNIRLKWLKNPTICKALR